MSREGRSALTDRTISSPAGCEQPGCDRARSRWWLLAPAVLLGANVVVPLVWGDLYPFTSAPMFRDAPTKCCNYTIVAPDGQSIAAERFLCQRVYDGNPVGYGVGVRPPAVLEQRFGDVPEEAAVRRHFAALLEREENRDLSRLEVVQEVIGPTADGSVDVVARHRWRIEAGGP